ncbi:MAG TPA: NAD(P)-binding domain-containing protein [Candidatus Saccharimonadales bacterium]|nr:NAD(P)-binding domain-containing protein [Candidatus Saccharimonadales bacterium]
MPTIGEAAFAGPYMAAEFAGATTPESQVPGRGRAAVEEYFNMRGHAELVKRDIDPETQKTLYAESEAWLKENAPEILEPGTPEEYATYDREKVTGRLVGLAKHMYHKHHEHVTGFEVDATEAFVDAAFTMWEAKDDPSGEKLMNGSFAFVVPPRVSRETPEYGKELNELVHVLRLVKPELRAAMLRGVPPWVVDFYHKDERGNQGLLICANVTGDMRSDLSTGEMVMTSRGIINDAVDLAADGFGAWAIGYGATFPGIMKFGEATRRQDVVTTTGHAGTIVEIAKAIDQRHPNRETVERMGVIGLGAIGARAAEVLADLYPNAQVRIYDETASRIGKAMKARPERFIPAADNAEVIRESDVVVSAITRQISLRALGLTEKDVAGTVVVDDSQPGCFDATEVESLGGAVLWPIGSDENGLITREFCGYGDLMVNKRTDLFGCEAEVASLVAMYNELRGMGFDHAHAANMARQQAVRGPVNLQQVQAASDRFDRYGIGAAEPQSFGVRRHLPQLPRRNHNATSPSPIHPTPHAA